MAGGGINGVVSIYGMQQMDVIATLEGEVSQGPRCCHTPVHVSACVVQSCVTSIAISENGYFLATSAQSGEVSITSA